MLLKLTRIINKIIEIWLAIHEIKINENFCNILTLSDASDNMD